MALGGICGSLFGGYALNNFQMGNIFLIFSVLPSIQLFSCGFVMESPINSSQLPEFSTSTEPETDNKSVPNEDRLSTESPKSRTLMRKRSQKMSKKTMSDTSKYQIPEIEEFLPSQWFRSLQMASFSLFKAFRHPIILRYAMINNFVFLFLLYYFTCYVLVC